MRIVRYYDGTPYVVNSDGTYDAPGPGDNWHEYLPVGDDLTNEEYDCLNDDGTHTL